MKKIGVILGLLLLCNCQPAKYCSSIDCPDSNYNMGSENSETSVPLPDGIESIANFTDPTGEGASEAYMIIDVTFASGSYEISNEFENLLKDFSLYLLSKNPKKVIVHGHTDSVGSEVSNQVLSENRANAVKSFLLSFDYLQSMNFKSSGFGESQPIDTNSTAEGRKRNRRVEIYLVF